MRTDKGLTLLELILAMTILSGVVLAFSALNTSAARLSVSGNEEVRLQNELQYVLRHIESTIRAGRNPVVNPLECDEDNPCVQTLRVQVRDEDGNWINHTYLYSENAQGFGTIFKDVANGNPNSNPEILSEGVLVLKPGKSVFVIPPDNDDELVEVNLAARKVLNDGKIIALSGITKSILLRGGGS